MTSSRPLKYFFQINNIIFGYNHWIWLNERMIFETACDQILHATRIFRLIKSGIVLSIKRNVVQSSSSYVLEYYGGPYLQTQQTLLETQQCIPGTQQTFFQTQHGINQTQQRFIETQHSIIKTQHNNIQTQHDICKTQHKILPITKCRICYKTKHEPIFTQPRTRYAP